MRSSMPNQKRHAANGGEEYFILASLRFGDLAFVFCRQFDKSQDR